MSAHKQLPRGTRTKKEWVISLSILGKSFNEISEITGAHKKYIYKCLSPDHPSRSNAYAKNYYALHKKVEKKYKRWTEDEDFLILTSSLPDKELIEKLGRSMQAIHLRRWRLRSKNALG